MSEWWAVTARRRLEFEPRVLCVFHHELQARAECDRLTRSEERSRWKFGVLGYAECPVPPPMGPGSKPRGGRRGEPRQTNKGRAGACASAR